MKTDFRSRWNRTGMRWLATSAIAMGLIGGCRSSSNVQFDANQPLCSDRLQSIEVSSMDCDPSIDDYGIRSGPPLTISTFQNLEPMDLTLEQAVELALADSKVLQKLGGVVVNAPAGATTLYDQAIVETDPRGSVEAALSAFDAQLSSTLFFNHTERKFNNVFQALFSSSRNDSANFQVELSKQTAAGTRFAVRNITDYTNNNIDPAVLPFTSFRFNSLYNTVNQLEVRQPLLRGSGVMVNRIAGPNAIPGVYNGVLIARIRSDISLADFEANVRDLVRDVERSYWELYFAYRDLDTKLSARNSARETWENRKLRLDEGVGRPDEEAQARQQYYNFEAQIQNTLTGLGNGQSGVLGAERNLRRLLGMPVADNRVIRPITEPVLAPIAFDWNQLQEQTLSQSVELRRQKWNIRQRELELCAAKQLNLWRLDVVGQYGFRGFGDELFGERDRPEGSAVADMFTGQLDDWQVGLDLNGPIGNRQGHLAIRNAELRLIRDKTIYREQQKQLMHDLSAAYTELDRALATIKTSYNTYVATREELEPKRMRVEEGKDQVFFLLDAQQRVANAESAFYRSIIDYNVALMNLTYTTGGLLARYNVSLEEGDWSADNINLGYRNAARLSEQGPNQGARDIAPVSGGPFDQTIDTKPTAYQ